MAQKIHSITNYRNLENKRVLVRVDFNVPIKKGKVVDDSRLKAALPTIEYLKEKGAKIILVTHVGRPEGKVVSELSVRPIAKRLSNLLNMNVKVKKLEIGNWKLEISDDIVVLENVRFHPEEEKNDPAFAKELASLADIFVLDGFGVSHRADASVVGVAKYLPSYAGLSLSEEIKQLDRVMKKPKHPFVLILGGAKTETKIPVMKQLIPLVDHVLVGGAIANTYFAARGYRVGASLVDKEVKRQALLYGKKKKVIMPVDVVVGTKDGKTYRVVDIQKKPHQLCKKDEAILDIGPKTIRLFATYIKKAKMLVWNGAMGYFEQRPYHAGTHSVARLVAARSKGKAYGVIGGGETVEVVNALHVNDDIDFISMGGGAMLSYLGGDAMPGLDSLKNKS